MKWLKSFIDKIMGKRDRKKSSKTAETPTVKIEVKKTKPPEKRDLTIEVRGHRFVIKDVMVEFEWNEGAQDFIERQPLETQLKINEEVLKIFPDFFDPK